MSLRISDRTMVARLIVKDWQVYQKQLAGYVAGLLFALGLIGTGSPLVSAAGGLLLLVLLIVVGMFAIASSIMAERKEQTQPFVMSLPVTPMDVFWGKLLANLVIYLVPFLFVTGGMVGLILATPSPDGTVPWVLLIALFVLVNFIVSLCVAIAVESEGWNTFAMLALMTLIGPFIYWVTWMGGIREHLQGDAIVWSPQVLGLIGGELAVMAIAILAASWVHARKTSFL